MEDRYKILRAKSARDLEKTVNKYIADGYSLWGDIQFIEVKGRFTYEVCQTVYKSEGIGNASNYKVICKASINDLEKLLNKYIKEEGYELWGDFKCITLVGKSEHEFYQVLYK